MNPIEQAIQAAANAATASGFAQALDQVVANIDKLAEEHPVSGEVQPVLNGIRNEIDKQSKAMHAQAEQLKGVSNAASAAALQGAPDMTKIRVAMATLLGSG